MLIGNVIFLCPVKLSLAPRFTRSSGFHPAFCSSFYWSRKCTNHEICSYAILSVTLWYTFVFRTSIFYVLTFTVCFTVL